MSKNDQIIDVSGEIESDFASNQNHTQLQSSFRSMMQFPAGFKVSSVAVREWVDGRRQKLKPWMTFFATTNFSVPSNGQILMKRVTKNIEHFQSNYMLVSIILIIYCIVTSPLLLVAVATTLGAYYIVSIRNANEKLVIGGHQVALAHQYLAVSLLSFPIFYLAGATTALFWVIGASFFVIMVHASFCNVDAIVGSDDQPFELQMEEV